MDFGVDFELNDQVVIVTGGNAGIGKEIVRQFARQGAKVVIFATNSERGARTVEEIAKETGNQEISFYQVDVSNKSSVDEGIKQVLEKFGRVDILVNNAGITKDQLLMRMSEEDWDRVMDINAKSCYNLSHAIMRPMLKAKKGKILNIGSVVGLTGNPGQTNYAASKAAMVGFSKSLAKEVASRNITVNVIAPGFIETQMTEALNEEQKRAILDKIPLGKLGKPQDVAYLALFLASSKADYITGQVFTVDGGMVM